MTYGGGYYPPGTPGPRSAQVTLICKECGYETEGVLETDLGTSYLVGPAEDGCPKCGGDWDDDRMDEVEYEPPFDTVEERDDYYGEGP